MPLDSDPELACIVLTGNAKAFAAGADIKEMSDKTAADMNNERYFADWEGFRQHENAKNCRR